MITAAQRHLQLATVQQLVQAGTPARRACAEAGISHATFYRLLNRSTSFQTRDPKSDTATPVCDGPRAKRGRKPSLTLTPAEQTRLQYWMLIRENSLPAALSEWITDTQPESAERPGAPPRAEIITFIKERWSAALARHQRPQWPLSLKRAARVAPEVRAMFEGPRAYLAHEATERRGNFIVIENERIPFYAGAIYESDDESENEPFRFTDPATGEERLGRQSLKTLDVYSHYWLGFSHIGRARDAYRAEDIADHFADIVDQYGLPLVWRIERGRWDNNFIFGIELDQEGKRWGSLEEIIHLQVCHLSRQKGTIEGAFNFAQRLRAHGRAGEALSIGRTRGQFEEATKLMLQSHRGNEAALAKFWSIEESAASVMASLDLDNATAHQRRSHGNKFLVPRDLWASQVKRECPASERWRFCAVKQRATVRKGVIEVKVKHYPISFRFRCSGSRRFPDVLLEHGHEVLIAFSPSRPEDGCHVFNADGSARNREGFGFAQFIGVADWMPEVAQIVIGGQSGGSEGQRAHRAQVRRAFRALIPGGSRKSFAQDGLGNVIRSQGFPACERSSPAPEVHRAPRAPVIEDDGDDWLALESLASGRGALFAPSARELVSQP